MKKLSGSSLAGVRSVLAAALVACLASTVAAQSAEEVINKSLEAQGGRKALTGLKSLERKGTVAVDGAFGQMEGSVEECAVPGKKAYRALDLAVFVQKDGFNGETAWRDGMMGIQELEGDEAMQIKQAVNLNPFLAMDQIGAKAEKLDDETIDDVEYYVIELKADSGPAVKVFVDKKSDQIARTTLKQNNPQFGEIEIVSSNSDYEDFGPVKLPTKNRIAIGDVLQIDTDYTETKVNGDLDQKIFEMPEDAAPPAEDDKKDDAKEEAK